MKAYATTAVIWIHLLIASTEAQTAKPSLAEALKDWKTLRVRLVMDGGDYVGAAPFILLQRFYSDRVFVLSGDSSGADPARSGIAPAPVTITNEAAQKLVDRATAFYAQAQKETGEKSRVYALPKAERDAILEKRGFGISSLFIDIQVLTGKGVYDYQDDFEDSGFSALKLRDWIKEASAASK